MEFTGKFKEGDLVLVTTDKLDGYGIPKGSLVTIKDVGIDDYTVWNLVGDNYWYIAEEDLELC